MQSPRVRQVAGAVGGALIALVSYQAFETVKPVVGTFFSSMTHTAAPEQYTDEDRQRTQDLIVGMAKKELQSMGIE